jgi:transposase
MTDSDCKPVFGKRAPAAAPAPRVRPVNRDQTMMLHIDVERLIPEDHAARGIWDMVGQLELKPFYAEVKSVEGRAGQPRFDPRLMISIWVYGMSRGINSARELAEWCQWEPGLQWLCAMDTVNYHSLSSFRAEHGEQLKQLFIELLGVLSAEGLIGLERVTVDGTRIRAQASNDSFLAGEKLQKCLAEAAAHVEAVEQEGEDSLSRREEAARERSKREREQRVKAARERWEQLQKERKPSEAAKAQVSVTEPEAQIMKQAGSGFAPSYNLQLATDAENKLVVAAMISDHGADMGLLAEVVEEVQQTCGAMPAEVIVDGGYISAENVEKIEECGIELIGPAGDNTAAVNEQARRRGVSEAYFREAFRYDCDSNTYCCPEGLVLVHIKQRTREGGRIEHEYQAKRSDCDRCHAKMQCCPTALTHGRTIVRSEPNPKLKAFREKMQTEDCRARYRQRSEVAEFPNAWLKQKLGLRRFRLRGIAKAGIESLWAVITYNVQQWCRLVWRPRLQAIA